MSAKPTKVYAVRGVFEPGVTTEDHEVPSKAEADELVATGLFALSKAEANALSPWEPEAAEDFAAAEAPEPQAEEESE